MILKEFAKIGKFKLRQLSGAVDYYLPAQNDVAQAGHEDNSIETSLQYIVKHKMLSKYQIQQMILYHFLHMDERGVIRDVSEQEIAKKIGCTIRTVRNNNAQLAEIGLIYYSNGSHGINIKLVGYEDYFAQKGYGYVEFDQSFLDTLKEKENVNSLRLEIRQEVKYDDFEVKRKTKKDTTPIRISFHDLKLALPKYTHYKSMIEYIAASGSDTFDTEMKGSDIIFTLKDGRLSRKEIKQNKVKEFRDIITEFVDKYKALSIIGQQGIADFVQLAIEYNMNNLLPALEELLVMEFLIGEDTTISYGARVRTIIRRNLKNKLTNQSSGKIVA